MRVNWLLRALAVGLSMASGSEIDPNSSLTNDFRPKHIHMDWTVDFETKQVYGSVTYEMSSLNQEGSDSLTLDANALDIHQVYADDSVVPFTVHEDHMVINFPQPRQKITIK